MKKQTLVLVFIAILMVPGSVMAMKNMHHDNANQGDGMSMGGTMIMLNDTQVDGMTASGHMMDIRVKMAEHGLSATHHFMVGFMDAAKQMVSDGQVALKIESPDGSVSNAIKLMGMSGQFGTDITLDQQGIYHFKIGTKFSDGNSRVFHMHYDNS